MADNIMGSLADQSTYDPATGMPYPGNAPDYGDMSQRMVNAQQRIAGGLRDWIGMPGRAFGTVPGGPPTPEEEANWGAGTAFGMLGASRMPGGAPAGAVGAGGAKLVQPEGIFAYHSSPYTFDKFDLSKIGTGEGAQRYGHGIYFAENPAVSGQGGQYWNSFITRFPPHEMDAAQLLKQAAFDREKAIALAQQKVESTRATIAGGSDNAFAQPMAQVFLPRDQAALDLLASRQPIIGPRTYEVNINARPEQMLNWDATLAQQSPYAQSVLEQLGSAQKNRPLLPTDTGRDVYYKQTQGIYNNSASQRLNEAGIPGIKYLDQGSRPGPGGMTSAGMKLNVPPKTYNYVIFDPNKLDIRKMYAVPGAVGAGAAGMGALATQDNYQPAGQ